MADHGSVGGPRSPLARLKARLGIGGWGELFVFAMPLLMWAGLSAPAATGLNLLARRYLPGWGWQAAAYGLAALLGLGLLVYLGRQDGDTLAGLLFFVMPFGIFWFLAKVFVLAADGATALLRQAAPLSGAWPSFLTVMLLIALVAVGLNRATAAQLTERVPQEDIDAASDGSLHELKRHLRPGDEIWRWETPKWTWDALIGRGGYVIVRAGKPTRHRVLAWMN